MASLGNAPPLDVETAPRIGASEAPLHARPMHVLSESRSAYPLSQEEHFSTPCEGQAVPVVPLPPEHVH